MKPIISGMIIDCSTDYDAAEELADSINANFQELEDKIRALEEQIAKLQDPHFKE